MGVFREDSFKLYNSGSGLISRYAQKRFFNHVPSVFRAIGKHSMIKHSLITDSENLFYNSEDRDYLNLLLDYLDIENLDMIEM